MDGDDMLLGGLCLSLLYPFWKPAGTVQWQADEMADQID
jgi:hypothetical protein